MATRTQLVLAAGLAVLPIAALGLTLHNIYFPSTRTLVGVAQPATELALNFPNRGRLTEIDVKVGDHVAKGQVLAKQDDGMARAELVGATAELAAAQANLALAQTGPVLITQEASQRAQIEAARAGVAKAQADVAIGQQALVGLALMAPAPGIITGVSGAVGEIVGDAGVPNFAGPAPLATSQSGIQLFAPPATTPQTPSTGPSPLLQMAVDGDWVVIAQVFEHDVARLHAGQVAAVRFDALPNVSTQATLMQILPLPVQVSNQVGYRVVFLLSKRPSQVLAGMTASLAMGT